LWELPEGGMKGLDAYQGHPIFFRREQVSVTGPEGPMVASTYRVAHQKAYIRPTDAYLARLRSAIRVQGLPPEALDILDEAARPSGPAIATGAKVRFEAEALVNGPGEPGTAGILVTTPAAAASGRE